MPLCANGEAQAPFAIHTELARAVTPPFNEARTGGPAQGDMMWSIKVISPCAHTISRLERATSLPAESQLYSDCVIVPSQASFPARFMQAEPSHKPVWHKVPSQSMPTSCLRSQLSSSSSFQLSASAAVQETATPCRPRTPQVSAPDKRGLPCRAVRCRPSPGARAHAHG